MNLPCTFLFNGHTIGQEEEQVSANVTFSLMENRPYGFWYTRT